MDEWNQGSMAALMSLVGPKQQVPTAQAVPQQPVSPVPQQQQAQPVAEPGALSGLKRVAADALMSAGAQTGKYLGHAFNNLPLPVLTGREIEQSWRGKMSPGGQDLYDNSFLYQEATDPLVVLGGLGKGGKVLSAVASPVSELAGSAVKAYGRVMDANVASRMAAKRAFGR